MAKVKFTAGRVADFKCPADKGQVFLWDAAAPGLGLRATPRGDKGYFFQSKLNGQSMRLTIGSLKAWSIEAAQTEARRLQIMIDNGRDPRQIKVDELAVEQDARDARKAAVTATQAAVLAEELERQALLALQARQAVTLEMVWAVYVAERSPLWSAHHIAAHVKMIQPGGAVRARSKKLTTKGPLATLADVRLVDLTMKRVEEWAKIEVATRPSSARLAVRLLKACLNWCAEHSVYAELVTVNAAKSSKARECLGKPAVKHDVLQREQLHAWFAAVRPIANTVISAYLQTLLITGARREELTRLRWDDVDFQWNSLKLNDKVESFRMVPMTPYVAHLLSALPRRNEWVFSSPAAKSGCLAEPRYAHNVAVSAAGLPHMTLHGLRRSFATLSEWTETPPGIAAQIQGHAPQGVRENNYIRRPLDLLRVWHAKIEAWMLVQAKVKFTLDPPACTPAPPADDV